ncbi:MAG: substrate-binding domain-containing protein [Verrucomicrobiota bacterium]
MRIGIVIETRSQVYQEFGRGASAYVGKIEGGLELISVFSHYSRSLIESELDGLVIVSRDSFRRIASVNLPVLFVDRRSIPQQRTALNFADQMIGEIGAEYFIERGFENLAFCYHDQKQPKRDQRRMDGLKKAIAAAEIGLPEPNCFAVSDKASLARWILSISKPLGILCSDDSLAADIIQICATEDINVPQTVSVLGVGNDDLICSLSEPAISSIDVAADRLGYLAVQTIHEHLLGKRTLGHPMEILPRGIVERGSTDVFPVSDLFVRGALRFIHDKIPHAIQVGDICEHLRISRRSLEKRFKSSLGTTINAYMQKTKLDEVKRLLRDTDFTLDQICTRVGYQSSRSLCRAFNSSTSKTPTQYREEFAKLG